MSTTNDLWMIALVIVAFGVAVSLIVLADGIAMWLNGPDEEHPNDNHDN